MKLRGGAEKRKLFKKRKGHLDIEDREIRREKKKAAEGRSWNLNVRRETP